MFCSRTQEVTTFHKLEQPLCMWIFAFWQCLTWKSCWKIPELPLQIPSVEAVISFWRVSTPIVCQSIYFTWPTLHWGLHKVLRGTFCRLFQSPASVLCSQRFTWMQPCDKGFEVGRRDDNLYTKNKQKKSHWNVARQKDWSVTISLCSLLGPYLFTPNPRPFSSCLCTSKVPVTSRDRAFHAVTWRSGNLSPPSSDWFNWGMIHDFLHHEKHTVLIWKILWILWFLYKSLIVQTKFAIIFVQTTTRIDDLHSWPQGTSHGRKIHEAKLWVVCSLDLQFLPGLLSLFFTLSTQRIYDKHLRNGKGFISTYLYIVYVSFL